METHCEALWKCVPDNDDQAKNVIHRIAQFFQRELTSEERDVALYVLLQEERGLGTFISQCIPNKFFHKVVSDIFILLSYLVECYNIVLDQHVVKILEVCTAWLRNPTSSDSKDKALDCLITILRLGIWSVDLNVPSLLELLLRKTPSVDKYETPTVLRKVYTLIGIIAEVHPDGAVGNEKRIMRTIRLELKHQTTTASKVEFMIIEGCFDGLSGYIHSFSLDPIEDEEVCCDICDIVMKVLKNHGTSRHTAHRAALNFLSRHGEQFPSFLLKDYRKWHHVISLWLSQNKDERASAKLALLTFYKVVSSTICNSTVDKVILQFFIDHFKEQFASSVNIDIAIKGFGLFSRPCKLQMPAEIPGIFNLLAQRAEEACHNTNKHKLVDYVESLAALSAQLGVIHSVQLSILEGLSVHLITHYPHEDHPDWQAAIINSIIATVLLLSRCSGVTADFYLSTTVYQGLLRTVSHPVLQDVALFKEMGRKVITYKNYLPLWHRLVTLNISGKFSCVDGVFGDEKEVTSALVFDKITYSFFEIIHRLDLTLQEDADSEAIPLNDVEKCVKAAYPQDFTVLVNSVDFFVAFLNDLSDITPVKNWIGPLLLDTIKLSTKNPLVSSFYKLLANIVKVASHRGYFEQEDMVDVEWRTCMNLLSGFLHDVILRHSQYKGDLQVACLQLILATPSNIASTLFPIISCACESVFRMGSSMLALAQEGLKTLTKWHQEIPKEKMKPLLKCVLPIFDRLLQTKDALRPTDDEYENGPEGMDTVRKVAISQKKKKKSELHALRIHTDTELGQLQTEITLFLSGLDSDTCVAVWEPSEGSCELVTWQKEKFLEFSLPYSDMKLPIQFDELLPRISDLALNCSDRQTRSSACELLHAVIMFMLGKEKQLESSQGGQLTDLWKRVFPIIFRLACDADLLINQLYWPLGEQLAHWYSSKMHVESPQASAFLEALLNDVTHDTDAALRDYSSVCLHEYVLWSRKQGNIYKKVTPLLKQIVSLCQHPSSHKRMGAALAFNSMYRILREDREIVDEFWLELLHCFCVSLSLCSINGEEAQTEKQIEKSLCHIKRVLKEKSAQFNAVSNRRIPKAFTGCTLWHGVRWLLDQCSALSLCCRRNAMTLVRDLAPKVSDCRSVHDILEKIRIEEGPKAVSQIVEGTFCFNFQISDKNLSWDKAMKWVHSLLANMDFCIWLMEDKIAPTAYIDVEKSSVFLNITDFLNRIAESPVHESSLWRPKAMENFSTAKCTCVFRLMQFLTSLLKMNLGRILNCFWNDRLWEIVTYCTLWPSHIGFDTSSKSAIENLPPIMEDFLHALKSHSENDVVCNLKECLQKHAMLTVPEILNKFSVCVREDKVEQRLKDLIEGLKTLHKIFQDTEEWSGLTAVSIYQCVFSNIVRQGAMNDYKIPVPLGPGARSLAESLLLLSFCLSNEVKTLIDLTCDTTPLYRGALQGELSHGEHFVISFKSVLTKKIIQNPMECIQSIEELLSKTTSPLSLSILPALLKVDFRKNSKTRENLAKFVSTLLSRWSIFTEWAKNDEEKKIWLVSILNLIVKLDLPLMKHLSFSSVCSWILDQLSQRDQPLHFKTNLITLLPLVTKCGKEKEADLKKSLNIFKEQHFPLFSNEVQKGTDEFNNLVKACEEILKCAHLTGNIVILELVIRVMITYENYPCSDILPVTLESFMARLKEEYSQQRTALVFVYDMFNNVNRSWEYRLRILNYFLLPLLKCASRNAQNGFAEDVIFNLVKTVLSAVQPKCGDEIKKTQTLLSHIGSWNVLQLIFGFSSSSRLEEKGSELVKAAFKDGSVKIETGKELVKLLTKKASDGMSTCTEENWNKDYKEMWRLHSCALYNMLATILCNLKTSSSDIKLYEVLLFTENKSKNRYIWRNIVDMSKTYIQPYEHSGNMKSVKQLVTIRRQLREEIKTEGTSLIQSLDLLGSQSAAFAGTLEADITRFDFTHSSVLAAPLPNETEMEIDDVVLESDNLNNHECMAMLCAVIRHMVDSKITPVPEVSDGDHPPLPQWMQQMQSAMLDSTCPRNACIFLLRLILNCESYFSPYAFHWMAPALECTAKHCLQSPISYLVGDLVSLFVKWSSVAPPSESHRIALNAILHFLIENCYSKEHEVLRFHFELIKSIVGVWKQFINPPFDLLHQLLAHCDKRVGIHLTAIMLFDDIAPWTEKTKSDFFRFLMKGLQESKKSLYKISAETIGLCFKYFNKNTDGEWREEDKTFLGSVMSYTNCVHFKQEDADRFLTILHALHDKVPQELDSLMPVLFYYLVQTSGDTKALCLSLLCSRLECLERGAFREFKERGIDSFLLDRNVNIQTQALQILYKLTPSLLENDLLEVTRLISIAPQLESKDARQIAYEIALTLFDQLSLKKGSKSLSDHEKEILNGCKAILLWGLVDKNLELKKKAFTLWAKEERLPIRVSQRLFSLLDCLYSPLTEEHFLEYAIELMMDASKSTPDYDSLEFQHGLEQCTHKDVTFVSGWRAQHASMAPMFAQSFASQLNRPDSLNSSFGEASALFLSTQNSFIFQQTPSLADGDNASFYPGNDESIVKSGLMFSSTSQLSSTNTSSLFSSQNFKQGPDFGKQRMRFSQNTDSVDGVAAIPAFRSRRYLGQLKSSNSFSVANLRRMKKREESRKERAQKREGQVEVFRKYRTGDFPDIQIKTADFITPLKELAKRDSFVARRILVSHFVGVKQKLNSDEESHFMENMSSVVSRILETSKTYDRSVIGALLEVSYAYKLKLNPTLVCLASKKSGHLSLGALWLESQVDISGCVELNKSIWLSMTELYDVLGERDVAHSILLSHVDAGEDAKKALHAHAEENWYTAKKLYFQTVLATQADNFYESLFECMVRLSEWKDVNRIVREQVDGNLDDLWEESWHEEKLLPRFIHSEVLKIIQDNQDENNFLRIISQWSSNEEKAPILKNNFSEYLSILYLLKKNVASSRYYAKKRLAKFIDNWGELNPLFIKQREQALFAVQPAAEILVFLEKMNYSQSDSELSAFLRRLESVVPATHDSLTAWETRITYRTVFLKLMPDIFKIETTKAFIELHLCLIESALKQNNMIFAKKYIDMLQTKVESCGGAVYARWVIARCQERHLWAKSDKVQVRKPIQRLSNFLQVWKMLDDVVGSHDLDGNPQLSISAHTTESNISCSVKLLLRNHPVSWEDLVTADENNTNWLSTKLQLRAPSSNTLIESLENLGLRSLIHCKNMTKKSYYSNDRLSDQVAGAYMCIAQYCRNTLTNNNLDDSDINTIFTRHFLQGILSAMRYGSSLARQLFPLLLQLPNLSTELAEDFKVRSEKVPEWMFLGWIPQLLAVLDSELVSVVMPLLLKLAEKYPNAVYYPYNISREKYKMNQINSLTIAVQRLDSILKSNSSQMQFIKHLSCLCHPSLILKHHLKDILTILNKEPIDWGSLLKICSTIFSDVLQEDPDSGSRLGDVGAVFSKLVGRSCVESFSNLYKHISQRNKDSTVQSCVSLKKLIETIEEKEKTVPKTLKLKDLSPWLAAFSSSKLAVDIEIPGQYYGDKKPFPERHIMISGFVGCVQVMLSMRKPVKFTIIGSDAQHYDFLLKFGEDLRQDERVQQLFSLMNGVFQNNPHCWNRRLSVLTYKVMPLSNRLGLIEWVGDTCSLKELMYNALSKPQQAVWNNTKVKHGQWFNDKRYSCRADTVKDFINFVSSIPMDVLRSAFTQRSSSAEAFYSLRHKFITSYSTMCIAQWLIGVGDRHLSNCLMSLKSGQCVGIDFGHTFGTATQFLPVPELIPFRLTPHIVELMVPFRRIGLIEETMVHCLRALRSDSELLLATMQVFILEPSLDWLQFSQKAIEEGKISIENCAWLPTVKINQAQRKLEGVNPMLIVFEDLESGHKKKNDFNALCKTLQGDPETSVRRKLADKDLSAREQIESLIDLATDPEVLCKTFHGWEPWV